MRHIQNLGKLSTGNYGHYEEINKPKKMNRLQAFFSVKEWQEQSFSEKIGTIFHLIGTKDGRAKLKADYEDGCFNGLITTGRVVDNFDENGNHIERTMECESVSIFAREENE